MSDHKDFLRRARMAQLLNKDDVPSRPERAAKDDGHRDDASRTEPAPDDALLSEGTLEVLKDAGHLAARLGRWTWAKTKDGCTFALAKGGEVKATWRLRRLKHQTFVAVEAPKAIGPDDEEAHVLVFGRDNEISRGTIEKMLAALQDRDPDGQEGAHLSDGVGTLPAELSPLIDVMIKPGVDFAPLEGLDGHSIAAALSGPHPETPAPENDEPASAAALLVEWPGSSARALRFIHVMFVFLALLSAALFFAWWKKHGAPEAEPAAAAVPTSEVSVPTPVEAIPAPVARPTVVEVAVEPVAAPTPVVEPAPVQLPPPVRAPDARAAKPSAAPVRPAVAKPKPVPAPAEEWQDKAAEDIDAWAEQMGIEADAD
ncbi:hypothetical protein [Arenimonas sp. MALMAid1274]|uniref:hypothetical protein n=1 Tax=Arenimonas sp. MALMAid1274 TaxID=3411630 RepID=UPI003B9F104C